MRGRKPEIRPQSKPTTAADAPAAPAWLSEAGRAEWDRVLSLIAGAGALAKPDADVLAAYCETVVVYRTAVAQIHAEGITFTTDDGMVKRHPATAIASDARKDLLRLAAELGMTPVSRQRLKIEPGESDPLQDFLDGGMRLAE